MEPAEYLEEVNRCGAEYVVFDLGGVLLEVDPPTAIAGYGEAEVQLPSMEEVEERCRQVPEVRGFETGEVSAREFGEAVVETFGLPWSVPYFLDRYKSLIRGVVPAMERLLQELTAREYRLACLSNTNPLHWQWVEDNTPLSNYFHRIFLSFEMGVVKPEPRIFQQVLEALGVAAEKVLFFDDKAENIRAARDAGMRAQIVS